MCCCVELCLILQKLSRHGYIETIHEALKKKFFRVSDVGIPGILHFLYKAKSLGQFTEPAYDTPYSSTEERERLFNLYQCIYSRMHSQQRPLKILFHVGKYEAILGWVREFTWILCINASEDWKQLWLCMHLNCCILKRRLCRSYMVVHP